MPFVSRKKYRELSIQANEAERRTADPLQGPVLSAHTATIRKNNYKTISSQITGILNKYLSQEDYGNSLVRRIIDMRTAIIAGEGLNWTSTKPEVRTFLEKVMDTTGLETTELVNLVRIGEMEGRLCIVPQVTPDKKKIYLTLIREEHKYTITGKESAYTVKYKDSNGKEITLSEPEFVYIRMNQVSSNIQISPPLVGTVLTQIDNFERALYDLRENNHLFGMTTPVIETQTWPDTVKILERIKAVVWKIGKLIAGPFKFTYAEPTGNAVQALKDEMSLNIKTISTATSLPVHWLGWTDLMSNRATADELEEMIAAGTKLERLIYIRKLKELIQKIMFMAKTIGIDGAVNAPDDFDIDLPYISLAYLKNLSDVWQPLHDNDVISMRTLRNKVPGINPADEEKWIKAEKKEAVKNASDNMGKLNFRTQTPEEIKAQEQEKNNATVHGQNGKTQIPGNG
jgi:hypothetical protein